MTDRTRLVGARDVCDDLQSETLVYYLGYCVK